MRGTLEAIQDIVRSLAESRLGWGMITFFCILGVGGGMNGIRNPILYDRFGQIFLEGLSAQIVYTLIVLAFFPLGLYAVWKSVTFRSENRKDR